MRKLFFILTFFVLGGFTAEYVHMKRQHLTLRETAIRSTTVAERFAEVNRAQERALESCRTTLDTEVDMAQMRLMNRINITKAQQQAYKKKFGRDFRQDELDTFVLTSLRAFNGDNFTP